MLSFMKVSTKKTSTKKNTAAIMNSNVACPDFPILIYLELIIINMKPAAPAMAVLLLLVLAVSGCTIPGTDIEIPGIPDFFGGGTQIDYTDDIIVIRNLQVTPGTTVKAGQTLNLYADIQNVQDPEKTSGEDVPVEVELYDHCTSLFGDIKVNGNPGTSIELSMSPQEIDTVSWSLTARDDVNLITPCELKVKVTYKYDTGTVTSITFIDDNELQDRIRRGESWRVSGSTTRGSGPVKVYLDVETQQPVSDKTPASISMKIRNDGTGFVKDSQILKWKNDDDAESFFVPPELSNDVVLEWLPDEGGKDGCDFAYSKDGSAEVIKVVRKESTPVFCRLGVKDESAVEVEQTYTLNSEVQYTYEFRKSIMVQAEPK
jgi:hypothetical protein